MDPYTLTLAPEDTFEVTAFTAAEYCTPSGHRLGQPNATGIVDVALLTRAHRRVVRAPDRLFLADVRRAAAEGWTVWLIHLHQRPAHRYEIGGVTILTPTDADAQALTDQLEAAQTPDTWAAVTAPYRDGLFNLISAYLTGEP